MDDNINIVILKHTKQASNRQFLLIIHWEGKKMNVYINASILLVSILLVLGIISHYIFLKKINKKGSFVIVEAIFILIILLGMLVINKTSLYYENTMKISDHIQQNSQEKNDSDNENSSLINSLVSMQANTLTVTAVIVTITSLIISILTIYRERKTEANSEKVDQSIQKLNNTEKMLQELAAISSILLLNSGQQEVFISIIQQEIEKLSKNSDNASVAYTHFYMILMNMDLFTQHYMIGKQNGYEEYDSIIEKANKIIENENSTQLSRNFAYIERVHAAYQKLKNSTDNTDTQEKRNNIERYINDARKYLKELDKQKIDDLNGHIANLTGLIELWIGIAKTRIYESGDNRDFKQERIEHYSKANKNFEIALEHNTHKVEFKNHKVVTLLRLADVDEKDEAKLQYLKEATAICEEINKTHPSYLKSRINYADAIARRIRIMLNITVKMDKDINHIVNNYSVINKDKLNSKKINETKNFIKKAKEALRQAKDIDETFPNSYYKTAEILILELCFSLEDLNTQSIKKIRAELDDNLSKAEKMVPEKTKIYIYNYTYLCLMENYYSKNTQNNTNQSLKEQEELKSKKEEVVQLIRKSK